MFKRGKLRAISMYQPSLLPEMSYDGNAIRTVCNPKKIRIKYFLNICLERCRFNTCYISLGIFD
jgi:hypothetical protein